MKNNFEVVFLEEAIDFLEELEENARRKIIYNIRKAQVLKDNELFKKIDNDIWEFRTLYSKTYYRLFAFWDKSEKKLIIVTNGFTKKTSKTPSKDIKRARLIMFRYLENREKRKK